MEEESTTGSLNRLCRAMTVPSAESLETNNKEEGTSRKRRRCGTE